MVLFFFFSRTKFTFRSLSFFVVPSSSITVESPVKHIPPVAPGEDDTVPSSVQASAPAVAMNLPVEQLLHEVWPTAPCAVPGAQSVQASAPAVAMNLPVEQSLHEVWPTTPCAVPGAQSSHAVVPDAGATLPISQRLQNIAPDVDDA